MALSALLFSKNPETAQALAAVLAESGMRAEICADIFSAIEKGTKQAFPCIIVDWPDQPEASFLLKRARESGVNRGTVAIAIVDDEPPPEQQRDHRLDFLIYRPIAVDEARAVLAKARQKMQLQSTVFSDDLRASHPDQEEPPAARPRRSEPCLHCRRPSQEATSGLQGRDLGSGSIRGRSRGLRARANRTLAEASHQFPCGSCDLAAACSSREPVEIARRVSISRANSRGRAARFEGIGCFVLLCEPPRRILGWRDHDRRTAGRLFFPKTRGRRESAKFQHRTPDRGSHSARWCQSPVEGVRLSLAIGGTPAEGTGPRPDRAPNPRQSQKLRSHHPAGRGNGDSGADDARLSAGAAHSANRRAGCRQGGVGASSRHLYRRSRVSRRGPGSEAAGIGGAAGGDWKRWKRRRI